ncbi:hypothetical protein ACRYCC_22590 [Actinomadura scrupuli]|uniref:hypothetical protein n=1 Tax=Actinomadura scrupuli TaxID=559629 RepID=UPI003D9740C8
MNTVKRSARAASADDLLRPPQYRQELVDPYRDHPRRRLTHEPAAPVPRLLAEIRDSAIPAARTCWCATSAKAALTPSTLSPSPRQMVSWLMTRPKDLPVHRRRHLDEHSFVHGLHNTNKPSSPG